MKSERFQVTIQHTEPLPLYQVTRTNPDNAWQSKIARLQEVYLRNASKSPNDFTQTITQMKHLAISNNILGKENREELLDLVFSTLNLELLVALLSDPEITEIFSNKIGNPVIVTHRQYGRCKTNLTFRKEFWQSLKIRAEYDTGQPLNVHNTALKVGLTSELGQLRISLQVPPLSIHGPTFSIRRLPSHAISLEQLVKDNQITSKLSSFLLQGLASRQNIIIAGEPGSGKTTLANALLLEAIPSWRIIVLEDAREIALDPKKFPLMIHYSLPAVGVQNRFMQRKNEIARLLHRSPDYVFLGEIQTKEDTAVAFEGFAAGLSGMATTHAKDLEGLLDRWVSSHNLPSDLVSSIDIIVITAREIVEGKVELGIAGLYQQVAGEMKQIEF